MLHLWVKFRQKKFSKAEWLNHTESRKYFYRDIIKSNILINKRELECEKLLGSKNRQVYYKAGFKLHKWEYLLFTNLWDTKHYWLMILFEEKRVIKIKLISRNKQFK